MFFCLNRQKTAKLRYVFDEKDKKVYYIHHLSSYEHQNHMTYGFEIALNKTEKLSAIAYRNECTDIKKSHHFKYYRKSSQNNYRINSSILNKSNQMDYKYIPNEYIAFIPFYGGLPPDLSVGAYERDNLGQGNSRVNIDIKAMVIL